MRWWLGLVWLAAAAASPPAEVPPAQFVTWLAFKKETLRFTSDGVTIVVAPLPCPEHSVGDSACRWDGYNNQASITVSHDGGPAYRTVSDPQSSHVRVAAVRLERTAPRPAIIIDSQYGGSGGVTSVKVLVPTATDYRPVSLAHGRSPDQDANGRRFPTVQGEAIVRPAADTPDGSAWLILRDPAFDSVFGCNACTPRPPLVFTIRDGRSVDISADPATRPVFASDIGGPRSICLSTQRYRNGACAAYMADAARLGRLDAEWPAMLAHYDRTNRDGLDYCDGGYRNGTCPPGKQRAYADFPSALRAFLIRAGYWPVTR